MPSEQIKRGVGRAPNRSLLYALGLTEGIRAGNHRQLSIPQSRFARQPPLHKGAFGAAV